MEAFPNPPPPGPLALTDIQQQVVDALRQREGPDAMLSRCYLGALWTLGAAQNPDRLAQAAHSLRELMEKLPTVVQGARAPQGPQFQQRRAMIKRGLMKADPNYPNCEWLERNMTPGLAATLDVTVEYLELSETYSRSARIVDAITALDPMFAAAGRQRAAARAERYQELWAELESITHHEATGGDFVELLSELDNMILDLVAPVVTDDQKEIMALLEAGPDVIRSPRLLKLIERRGANLLLFFQKVQDPAWLDALAAAGHFSAPPPSVKGKDGQVFYDYWWAMAPLPRMVVTEERKVVDLVVGLPATENPRVLQEIAAIALAAPSLEQSLRLKGRVLAYVNLRTPWLAHDTCSKLIKKWSVVDQPAALAAAITLAAAMLNLTESKEDGNARGRYSGTRFNPPRGIWEYRETAEKALVPLMEAAPMDVARMLSRKLRKILKAEVGEQNSHPWNDGSRWWCGDLRQVEAHESDPRAILAVALTRACLLATQREVKDFSTVKEILRQQPGQLFDRILWTVYRHQPTTPVGAIIEEIVAARYYGQDEYDHEFRHLVTDAFKRFGPGFLTQDQQEAIFTRIRSGPDQTEFREVHGQNETTHHWAEAQRRFHLHQLAPFAPGLFGQHATYFDEISDHGREWPTEASYYTGSVVRGGLVQQRSPKSAADLGAMDNAALIDYLNVWEDAGYQDGDFLIEINFRGLGCAFRELIEQTPERFGRWSSEWQRIVRPIYLSVALEAGTKLLTAGHTKHLATWFALCGYVLQQPVTGHKDGHESSAEKPNWGSCRRAVTYFLEAVVDGKHKVPNKWSKEVWSLVAGLCTGADPDLEHDPNVDREAFSTAINRTRSRALEVALGAAAWTEDPTPCHRILEQRFASSPVLTLPERALLAVSFPRIYALQPEWAKAHVADVFPQSDENEWIEVFGSLILYTRPNTDLYEVLKPQFAKALTELEALRDGRNARDSKRIDHLAQHLFIYYLHGLTPLSGRKSQLRPLLQGMTEVERGRLFHYAGLLLNNSKTLPPDIAKRLNAYFEERARNRDSQELAHFSLWLQAACLPVEWRLKAYSKLLGQPGKEEISAFSEVQTLAELAVVEPALAMECFYKLTVLIPRIKHFYVKEEHVQALLNIGLGNGDAKIRSNAERSKENLLANGQSGYLN